MFFRKFPRFWGFTSPSSSTIRFALGKKARRKLYTNKKRFVWRIRNLHCGAGRLQAQILRWIVRNLDCGTYAWQGASFRRTVRNLHCGTGPPQTQFLRWVLRNLDCGTSAWQGASFRQWATARSASTCWRSSSWAASIFANSRPSKSLSRKTSSWKTFRQLPMIDVASSH